MSELRDRSAEVDGPPVAAGAVIRSPALLYDSVRALYYPKPVLRGWLHLVWFEAALVLGTLLIIQAHGAKQVMSASIFAGCVAGMFGVSAFYHRGNWTTKWNARLQRADHAMIFLVIAGTATPVFVLASPGQLGLAGLIVLWIFTGVAVVGHSVWMDAPELAVGGSFLVLGAIGSAAIPEVWIHVGTAPALLLIVASVLHATGAVSYHRRSPDPRPSTFGYHEVFHAYVCIAAACQYIAIGVFIL